MSRFNLKSKLWLVKTRERDRERDEEEEEMFDFQALSVDYCVFPTNLHCI